jgi:hypothetical protein
MPIDAVICRRYLVTDASFLICERNLVRLCHGAVNGRVRQHRTWTATREDILTAYLAVWSASLRF